MSKTITSEYTIRNFEDGDENEIMQIFESNFSNYGGYVPRTIKYWRWSCLERPDVERKGIFVVTNQSEAVVGYAVVGKSGHIWEFSYEPMADGETIVSMLLEASTIYLQQIGTTSIVFNAPSEDGVLSQVCNALGFVTVPSPRQMFLSIPNLRELVSLLAKTKNEEISKFNETVLVKLKSGFQANEEFFMRINGKEIEIVEDAIPHTIQIEADYISFASMLFGMVSPSRLFLGFKLRVKPFWKTSLSLRLLRTLQITSNWYFPLSDYG